jgi:hypothetical protein
METIQTIIDFILMSWMFLHLFENSGGKVICTAWEKGICTKTLSTLMYEHISRSVVGRNQFMKKIKRKTFGRDQGAFMYCDHGTARLLMFDISINLCKSRTTKVL